MECWNIILLTILALIIFNILFWCYCIFFRRKNRCGNLQFTIKYVNKKNQEGAIIEDDNDDDNDDDNLSEDQNGQVYEMCKLSDVGKSSWKYKRPLPRIPELIEENYESDKLLVNGNNDEQKLNMAAGGAPEQGKINTGDSEKTKLQMIDAAPQLHPPPPPPPPSPHTLPPPSPPPLPLPTWMWETPAEFKNDPVYQVLDDNDWDKYVRKGGD